MMLLMLPALVVLLAPVPCMLRVCGASGEAAGSSEVVLRRMLAFPGDLALKRKGDDAADAVCGASGEAAGSSEEVLRRMLAFPGDLALKRKGDDAADAPCPVVLLAPVPCMLRVCGASCEAAGSSEVVLRLMLAFPGDLALKRKGDDAADAPCPVVLLAPVPCMLRVCGASGEAAGSSEVVLRLMLAFPGDLALKGKGDDAADAPCPVVLLAPVPCMLRVCGASGEAAGSSEVVLRLMLAFPGDLALKRKGDDAADAPCPVVLLAPVPCMLRVCAYSADAGVSG